MKANPGGQIDLNAVLGRDETIAFIWDTLSQQSIIMTAERRIGKTTILNKIARQPRPGWVPIFQDLEQYGNALDFAQSVHDAVEKFLSRPQKLFRSLKTALPFFSGTKLGPITLPDIPGAGWQDILTASLQAAAQDHKTERAVFLWDEFPYLLDNIKTNDGETVAMQVLDTLRALRQTQPNLRMILTGSIGLHHVMKSLKDADYKNAPVNDMYSILVPTLDPKAAQQLADKLLLGENIAVENRDSTSRAIAHAADGFPFYIHHIVKAMKQANGQATPDVVDDLVSQQLVHPDDPWELKHYVERIPLYYGHEQQPMVLGILDAIALCDTALSVNDLLTELKACGLFTERETLIEYLGLLEKDHYLSRTPQGHYRFQFALLQRWWKLTRGL